MKTILLESGGIWMLDMKNVKSEPVKLRIQGYPDQPLHGCLPVSGLFELAPLAASHVQDWMQFTPAELAQSPMRHPPHSLRGTVALAAGTGEAPGFHRQSQAFAALTGWPLLTIDGRNHFDLILDLTDPDTAMSRALIGLCKGVGAKLKIEA